MEVTRTYRLAAIVLGALLLSNAARAEDPALIYPDENRLQSYDPMTVGYTKDNDDVSYIDATLSLKYRLLPLAWTGKRNRFYFTFTGRFGLYWGTRPSAPVIGKSYNPKLVWRYLPSDEEKPSTGSKSQPTEYAQYLDFAYAHQSNGQAIETLAQYQAAEQSSPRPEFANEYLSRGWDYLQVVWKKSYGAENKLSSYVDLKYFLRHGLLEGKPEEFNSWETSPEVKRRDTVDGISALLQYQSHWTTETDSDRAFVSGPSISVTYQTGYNTPFRYSTFRLEIGTKFIGLPFAIWGQHGYMSDLANYYRKVDSYGVELRIAAF